MPTGLVYHDIYLEHRTDPHPETPLRLVAAMKHLRETGLLDELVLVEPRPAGKDELLWVHHKDLVDRVFETCERGGGAMDPDTPVSTTSCEAALMAAGGLFEAADRIMKGEIDNACGLVRPPGHHATPTRSMGFCLFNNIALCAKHLQKNHGLERILIVDWDVHHGNGTQDIFYDDPSVFYFSLHRTPFYPGSGYESETGSGPGQGFTLNVPFRYGVDAGTYMEKFREVMEGPASDFEPEFILISAGYDGYDRDTLAGLCLEAEHFADMTRQIMDLAAKTAEGRVLSTLEGGYNVAEMPSLIEAHIRALMGA